MQTMIEIDSPLFLRAEELTMPADWPAIFGNDRPLALEIGCGVGDFLVQVAEAHPELNFIAIDFYNKGCYKTCRRAEKHGLANVRVLREEARQFITERLHPGSLQRIYINCPDPWPKKRHRKRRLVNSEFVAFLGQYLRPDGELFFATDFDDYGLDVAEFMPRVVGFDNQLAPDRYRNHLEGYPLSKYMRKFMAEGKQIYYVHYKTLAKG